MIDILTYADAGSFHIMYYLLESKLEYLQLSGDASTYNYLKQSGCYKVGAINDKKEYETLLAAMKTIGFAPNEIQEIFKIVAGILHLGNIEFVSESDKTVLCGSNYLELAADLLATTTTKLESALLRRTMSSVKEHVQSINTAEQAVYTRDSLAKILYGRLFDYIVSRINQSVHNDKTSQIKSIGVLDIYGFEVFDCGNGFEQFCINYCNEKLQQLFIEMTLKKEQEEYAVEGIEWRFVEFFNNQIIIDLIESPKTGMIALLDEECLRPGDVSDKHYLGKMAERYGDRGTSNKFFESRQNSKSDKTIDYEQFRLKHYAGNVTYDVAGFLDKNMDKVSKDVKSLLAGSRNSIIVKLLPADDLRETKLTTTTITMFKSSLNELVDTLRSKAPHYIRCIKSNDKLMPNQFDRELVRHQVRYLALLENVRVRRAGFVFRQPYEAFLQRFRFLCPRIWPFYSGIPREATELLMKHFKVAGDDYRLGLSKVFIRKPNTLFDLEEKREMQLPNVAIMIQRLFRGYRARKEYERHRAANKIIKLYRGYKTRKDYERLRAANRLLIFYQRHRFIRYFRELYQTFSGVADREDLGKQLEWPQARSIAVIKGADYVQKIWRYWRAKKVISYRLIDYRQISNLRTSFNRL
jgi:myosin-1